MVVHTFNPNTWETEVDWPLWVQGVVVHTFNPSTGKAETDRSLWVHGQPGLYSKFQAPKLQRNSISKKKNDLCICVLLACMYVCGIQETEELDGVCCEVPGGCWVLSGEAALLTTGPASPLYLLYVCFPVVVALCFCWFHLIFQDRVFLCSPGSAAFTL